MATPSSLLALGASAPAFDLTDVVTQRRVRLADVAGPRGLLALFICRHCPYVKHVDGELAKLGRDYLPQGIGVVAISANDAEGYPEDAPASLKQQAEENGFGFPYLHDETQAVARAYGAVCTPEPFLFDAGLRLAYHGQIDDSRPSNGKPVTGADLRRALDAVVAGQAVAGTQKPSVGCSIKWR